MEKCKRSRSNSTNVLFIKDKSKSNNNSTEEPRTSVAFASGDCYVPRCRLCGGHSHLKYLTVDHYDEVLRRLFEVKVPSNVMICESCVKCLKICERFKALVHATFEILHVESPKNCDKITETIETDYDLHVTNPEKEIIELLKTRLVKTEKPKRRREIQKCRMDFKPEVTRKRANVSCVNCRQKYPMLVTSDGSNFTCSRCKQIELKNIDGKKNITSPLTLKRDGRKMNWMGKNRLNSQRNVRRSSNPYSKYSLYLPRHQCALCPKKYSIAENLAAHIKLYHEASFVCTICGKKNKNKEIFDRHMRQHSDLSKTAATKIVKKFRCPRMPVFKDHLPPIISALEINK